MTWLIEDRDGEIHEVLEDERVLVIGPNESYSRNWLLSNHLPPFGAPFTVPNVWSVVPGGSWSTVVWLEGWEANSEAAHFKRVVPELPKVTREIFA